MKLVVDANIVMSALISDSKTRELIVILKPDLLTPEIIHDEIENHEHLIVEKSGVDADRVQQFIELLFGYIETVPASEFYQHIEQADEAIGETDPDDVLRDRGDITRPVVTVSRWSPPTGVATTGKRLQPTLSGRIAPSVQR